MKIRKTVFCFLVAFVAVAASGQERLKALAADFEGTFEQRDPHQQGSGWVAEPVAVTGRWVVSQRFVELRGTYKFSGLPQPMELVFLWGWDPFQKEYRMVVLDDLVGLVDVFEQESAAPLTLSDFSHGTFFEDEHGRTFNRVIVHFLESGTVRMEWAASRDGKSWRDFARLTLKPRNAN